MWARSWKEGEHSLCLWICTAVHFIHLYAVCASSSLVGWAETVAYHIGRPADFPLLASLPNNSPLAGLAFPLLASLPNNSLAINCWSGTTQVCNH